jgi:hypothetical protein
MSQTGEQSSSASPTPSMEAVIMEQAHLDAESLEMRGPLGVDSMQTSLPQTDMARNDVAVSGGAPASLSDPDSNQVPKAHFSDMKPEQAVPVEGSTNYAWPDIDLLLEGLDDIDPGLFGLGLDGYLDPDLTVGNVRHAEQTYEAHDQSIDVSPATENSLSLSPLSPAFFSEASLDAPYNDASPITDFTLFDLDPALISLAPTWDDLSPYMDWTAPEPLVNQSQDERTNVNGTAAPDMSLLDSYWDMATDDLVAYYWQPNSQSVTLEDNVTIDSFLDQF